MAKKRTASRRPVTHRPAAPQSTAPAATSVPQKTAATAPTKPAPVDFAVEYRYVLGDLKHIGVLAAAMFATLIALALIIR